MDGERAPRIYTGLEDDKHATRQKREIESGWNIQARSPEFPEQIRELDVDSLISNKVEQAVRSGNNKLVVLDIGSGAKGKFINSFTDREQFPQLYSTLSEQPEMEIRVIGITSAEEGSLQLRPLEDSSATYDFDAGSRIIVENYGYTITAKHTLHKLYSRIFDTQNGDRISAVFSTFGLGYLYHLNFKQAVMETIDQLQEDGVFYCTTYNASLPGFERSAYGGGMRLKRGYGKEHPLAIIDPRYRMGLKTELSPKERTERIKQLLSWLSNTEVLKAEVVKKILINKILPSSLKEEKPDSELENEVRLFRQQLKQGEIDTLDDLLELLNNYGKSGTLGKFHWFYVFDGIYRALCEKLESKQAGRTTQQKQDFLASLQEREDLEVYFNELNFYIKRRKQEQTQQSGKQ